MKKKLLALLLMAVLTFALAACGGGGDSGAAEGDSDAFAGGQTFTIKIGHSDTTTNLINVSLENFAKYVEEQSGGAVKVDIYAAEQLGSNAEMAEMLEMGSLDAMMMPQGVEASYAPRIATLGLPFLFTDYEQAWAAVDNPSVAEKLTEELENYNLIQLAFWENGMRQLTNSVKEIDTPEDMEGLSFRIPDDDMTASIMRELKAKATKFAWSKTYDALKQGTFDGQENPVANIYANNIQEVNQYMTITNHKYESKNLVFSLSTWNKLPEDIQEVLREGAVTFGKEHREAVAANESKQLEELKASGMTVNEDPDIDAFKKATMNVYTQFELQNEWTAEVVAAIREAAAQIQ